MPLYLLYLILTGAITLSTAMILKKDLKKLLVNLFKDKNSKDLGILGMNASGKTRFLRFLQNLPYEEGPTMKDKQYQEFIYKTNNGRIFNIMKGKDISGANDKRTGYNKIMDNADVIFYFFNIQPYLKDLNYQRECNSRMSDIYEFTTVENKQLVLFASHSDLLGKKINPYKEFGKIVGEKKYKDLKEKMIVINLTNSKEVKEQTDLIFEN